jgi:hypothetical protein
MLRKRSIVAAMMVVLASPAFAAGHGPFGGGGHIGGFGGGRGSVWHFHSGGIGGGGAWHWHGPRYRGGYPGYLYGPSGGYDDSSCWGWDPNSVQWVWICD